MKENKPIILTRKKPEEDEKKSRVVDIEEVKPRFVGREMGEMIRDARTRHGLSQKELAHKMNRNVNIVNTWESGKGVYDERTAKKFEDVLNIKLNLR